MKELSVCIPIYQKNIEALVTVLITQCKEAKIDFEVCLIDDASRESVKKENREFALQHNEIRYKELNENVGRSAIRNQLADFAIGEFLLFLDCDVQIDNPNFIQSYLKFIVPETTVLICGGCFYDIKNKKDKELRYKYGKHVEELKIDEFGKPSSSFLGGNFLVSKSVFNTIKFDDTLVNYGYEDVLFSINFENQFGDYIIINNPVTITDVDTNEDFLLKTSEAMQNLAILYMQRRILPKNNVRLLLVFEELKSKKMVNAFYSLFKNALPMVSYQLVGSNPSLKLFQLFKLISFINNFKELESNYKFVEE